MSDRDLSGDDLKLVRHKIVFLKHGLEVAFREREELLAHDMDATGFTGWKIAQFIQSLGDLEPPSLWERKGYPHAYNGKQYIEALPHSDKKYLRVFFEVLERYPREEFRFQQRQLEALEGIREALANRGRSLSKEEEEVLDAIGKLGGEAATGQLSEQTGHSAFEVRSHLKALMEAGLVERVGQGFDTRYRLVKK